MSQNLLLDGFKWVEDIPSLNKRLNKFIKFIKKMMRKVMRETYLKWILII